MFNYICLHNLASKFHMFGQRSLDLIFFFLAWNHAKAAKGFGWGKDQLFPILKGANSSSRPRLLAITVERPRFGGGVWMGRDAELMLEP